MEIKEASFSLQEKIITRIDYGWLTLRVTEIVRLLRVGRFIRCIEFGKSSAGPFDLSNDKTQIELLKKISFGE